MLALLSALAADVAEPAKTINPVVPDDLGELFWGALSFFGLWILLRYVCLPPLMKVREQRAQQVIADQEAASAAAEDAEKVRRDYDATLAEARAEAAKIIEASRVAADEQRSTAISAVEGEVASRRTDAVAELDQARNAALDEIKGDVAQLAVAAASKVVREDLDVAANRAAVDEYVNQAGNGR